jgi:hypothetical protein
MRGCVLCWVRGLRRRASGTFGRRPGKCALQQTLYLCTTRWYSLENRTNRHGASKYRAQRFFHRSDHTVAAKPSAPITSLYYKSNIPIAIIEAKDNNHSVASGMQQALDYAVTVNIPFVFSSNGDGFVFHDRVELCRADAERRFVPRAASIAASSSNEGTRSCPGLR